MTNTLTMSELECAYSTCLEFDVYGCKKEK